MTYIPTHMRTNNGKTIRSHSMIDNNDLLGFSRNRLLPCYINIATIRYNQHESPKERKCWGSNKKYAEKKKQNGDKGGSTQRRQPTTVAPSETIPPRSYHPIVKYQATHSRRERIDVARPSSHRVSPGTSREVEIR
jgi:hypothetical protein